MENGHLEQSAY